MPTKKEDSKSLLSGVPASGEQTLDRLTNNTCQQNGGVMDLHVLDMRFHGSMPLLSGFVVCLPLGERDLS